ncbi:MAG: hypothetical protein AB8G23_18860 [Myxococcota bacterium]
MPSSSSTRPITREKLSVGLRILDAASFSSALAATLGAGLSLSVSQLLGASDAARSALLVAAGAFIIYSLDRLRDARRDATTSPLRTAFIERHRRLLSAATIGAALLLAISLAGAPLRTWALCAAIGGVGFFHRRLKDRALLKTLYVSAAWTLGLVGPPVLAARGAVATRTAVGLSLILFLTLLANLVASNLRDNETQLLRNDPRRALWIARCFTIAGAALALGWNFSGSPTTQTLYPAVWIPLAELAALAGFRQSERYGHLIVDGALLLGALATLSHLQLFR